MNSQDLDNVLMITDLVAKIGIPMIQGILQTVAEKSPSIAEIHKLRRTIKDPESYFEDDGALKPIIDMESFANEGLELDTSKLGVIPSPAVSVDIPKMTPVDEVTPNADFEIPSIEDGDTES